MLKRKRFQTVRPSSQNSFDTMKPTIGYVEQAIGPECRGRVRYQATYWFGVCCDGQSFPKGSEVVVIGRKGNTLMVKAAGF